MNEEIKQKITELENKIQSLDIERATLTKQLNTLKKLNSQNLSNASSLPELYKQRLLSLRDKRITKEGIVIIKAQKYRTQEKNRADAIDRLKDIIKQVTLVQKVRRPTKPTRGSQKRRMDKKTQRSKTKALRGKVIE